MHPNARTDNKTKIAHNDANIAKLAQHIVESMDADDVEDTEDMLKRAFKNNSELFAEEWENYFE